MPYHDSLHDNWMVVFEPEHAELMSGQKLSSMLREHSSKLMHLFSRIKNVGSKRQPCIRQIRCSSHGEISPAVPEDSTGGGGKVCKTTCIHLALGGINIAAGASRVACSGGVRHSEAA